MENTLNNLESKHLTFKLGEEQREALLSVFSFITNEDKFFTLCGSAGTGKSTIALLIIFPQYFSLHARRWQKHGKGNG